MKVQLLMIFFTSVFMVGCSFTHYTVNVPEDGDLPKNILLVSQSGTQFSLFQTVIDLENNEMVLLEYFASRLYRVYRTGISMNPKDYRPYQVVGTDAIFKSPINDPEDNDCSDDKDESDNKEW